VGVRVRKRTNKDADYYYWKMNLENNMEIDPFLENDDDKGHAKTHDRLQTLQEQVAELSAQMQRLSQTQQRSQLQQQYVMSWSPTTAASATTAATYVVDPATTATSATTATVPVIGPCVAPDSREFQRAVDQVHLECVLAIKFAVGNAAADAVELVFRDL